MPVSHDRKPRNKARREKAKLNNIIPALRHHKSGRQLRRMRSRHYTSLAYVAQNEVRDWLRRHGLRWRDYEKVCDQAQSERKPVASLLMAMATERAAESKKAMAA